MIILEVLRTGKAALFLDDKNLLQLLYRRGDETLPADGGKTIDWYRQIRREEMLIGLSKELRAFTRRIPTWSPFPEIPDPVLPYLARCTAIVEVTAEISGKCSNLVRAARSRNPASQRLVSVLAPTPGMGWKVAWRGEPKPHIKLLGSSGRWLKGLARLTGPPIGQLH